MLGPYVACSNGNAWAEQVSSVATACCHGKHFKAFCCRAVLTAFPVVQAVQQARRLAEDGADMLDVGGQSTRPGAAFLSAEDELERVLPVIR